MRKLLTITGPTAVGKSSLGVEIAEKINGEVVSADSMQIYKGMDIGTGKITESEKNGVPHYMLDIVEPDENYSVGRYVHEAGLVIDDILNRDKIPILVGGTGLYINSLIFGHSFSGVAKDDKIRDKLKQIALDDGAEKLYSMLKEVDPVSADAINKNDVKRIVRALEIYELTGKPRSDQKDLLEPRYDYLMIVLIDERDSLYKRIDNRVDKMFECGLLNEVERLLRYKNYNSMQAIGYKETVLCLEGKSTLNETAELIKQSSRRYAKRQLTFFRGMKAKKIFINYKAKTEIYSIINDFLKI